MNLYVFFNNLFFYDAIIEMENLYFKSLGTDISSNN